MSEWASKQNLLLFEVLQYNEPWTLESYRKVGGYSTWEKMLAEKPSRDAVIDLVKGSGLRGRGGAAFPTGMKWSFMPRNSPVQKYLVCNSDESEPGTCHDRDILRYTPHALIEGLAIGGYATNSTVAYNYIRGEFLGEPIPRFEAALKEAYEAGLLGRNIRGSGVDFDIFTFVGAGAYICGEETAMLDSLEGKPGKPRFKPPFPANYGLYGAPTTINNTQSFASVPAILRKGPEWFVQLGPKNAAGTVIFSVSGHVEKPANLELPLGIPFKDLLEMCGGVKGGRQLKAAGSAIGSAGVIVMDETTCMVRVLERITRFYKSESCGQCTPCREGTGWMNRLVKRILAGEARREDLGLLLDVANRIEGHTICGFGDASAWPVQSALKHFRHEFEYMIDHGGRSIVTDQLGAKAA